MINGEEESDTSEASNFSCTIDERSDVVIFSGDLSSGVNEANRSTEETKVHNVLDFFVVALTLTLGFDANNFVSFSSISLVLLLSLIVFSCRNAGRLLGQFGAFSIGV